MLVMQVMLVVSVDKKTTCCCELVRLFVVWVPNSLEHHRCSSRQINHHVTFPTIILLNENFYVFLAIFFLFKLYPKCYAILNQQQRRENLNLILYQFILIHDSVDFIHILAWEPSAAKVTKSYSLHLLAL